MTSATLTVGASNFAVPKLATTSFSLSWVVAIFESGQAVKAVSESNKESSRRLVL